MIERKRLFFDIETSPNIGFFWKAGYRERIPYDNIIKERAIICICYKWEGERKVHSLNWDDKQNDRKMLLEFVRIANQADELVGHNGDRFDLKWIRTRCLFHDIPMFPDYVSVDTLKEARRLFLFNSNRLDYVANYLGVGKKHDSGFDLWRDIVIDNSPSAMRKMLAYCKQDVKILEEVFKRFDPHLKPKQHYGVLNGLERGTCPNCGSADLNRDGFRTTAAGTRKIRYLCGGCHKRHTQLYRG